MKKIFWLILPVIMIFCISGCSEKEEKNISIYDLQKAVLEAGKDFPEMKTVNGSSEDAASLFTYLSDVEYEKVDGFFLSYAAEGESYEVAVVRMKENSDVKEMTDSLKAHVDDRINLYKNYEPEQVGRAEEADVFSEGKYAVLIMCDNKSDIKAAFENIINE